MAQDWQEVQAAAKDDSGNYVALINGQWIPVAGAAKNEQGEYIALVDSKQEIAKTTPTSALENILGNVGGAIAEPIMQMATGFAAKPLGELAAFGTMAANKLTGNEVDPAAMARTVQEQLTYQPRTAGGQFVSQNILAPIGGAIEFGAEALTKPFSGGNDIAAAGLKEAALQGVGFLGVKGAPKAASAIEASNAVKLAKMQSKNAQDAARIDAAKMAVEKYGLSLDPIVSNPNFMNKQRVTFADQTKLLARIRNVNEPKITEALRKDVGIPSGEPLTSMKPFEDVRMVAGQAEDIISKTKGFADDGIAIKNITALQPEALIGGKAASKKVASLIDDANKLLSSPDIPGARMIVEIKNLRKNANSIYAAKDIKPTQRVVADTYMGIANELESLIDRNLTKTNPSLLKQYQEGRKIMAKSYVLQKATNLNTGLVDPMILAKLTAKDNALTGAFADIGKIAGNFPESVGIKPGAPGGMKELAQTQITRTGLGGSIGYLAGLPFGSPLIGAAVGAGTAEILGNIYAKRLASNPAVQRTVSVPSSGMLSVPRKIAPAITRSGMLGTAFSPYIEEEQP